MNEKSQDQKWVKVDPVSGQIIGTGTVPAGELIDEVDHEGLLTFLIETTPHDYQFDPASWSLVKRATNPVVELRRLLAQERRPATAEEMAVLTSAGLAPTQAG